MTDPKFPGGFADFYYKVLLNKDKILNGTLVAMDPSSGGSSQPGFAVFCNGVLQISGTIELSKKTPIYQRLQILAEKVAAILPVPPDVFAIELIRGRMAHQHLTWAVGASIAACGTPTVFEIPIRVWKAVADTYPNYQKTDANDAEMQGRALILLAQRG